MSDEMFDSKTKTIALQNSQLLAGRRQDAACIQELHDAHAELTATVAQQAANIADHAAATDRQSSTHDSLDQVSCCLPQLSFPEHNESLLVDAIYNSR